MAAQQGRAAAQRNLFAARGIASVRNKTSPICILIPLLVNTESPLYTKRNRCVSLAPRRAAFSLISAYIPNRHRSRGATVHRIDRNPAQSEQPVTIRNNESQPGTMIHKDSQRSVSLVLLP